MKTTQVMLSTGWGGAERFFLDLCMSLADHGWKVQAICRPGFEHRRKLASHVNIQVGLISAYGNWDIWSARKMRRMVRDFGPALIHAHLSRSALMAGRSGSRLKLPVLATTHNYIKKKYIQSIDWFQTTTEDQRQHLMDLGAMPERIRRIPNFSMFPAARHPFSRLHSRPLRFLAYGRFVRKKGFDLLLKVFRQVANAIPEAELLIGGSGPKETVLRDLIQRLGLNASVKLVGWVDDVAGFLDSGDVFVLPSFDEPFGIVVLEAMSRGKLIVSTKTKGPSEILDESCAFLVDIGDEKALSSDLLTAAETSEENEKKQRNALNRYRNCYSKSAVLPQFMDYYRQIGGIKNDS